MFTIKEILTGDESESNELLAVKKVNKWMIIIIIIIINYIITFKKQLWSEGYLKFDYQISIIIHVALLLNTCDWSLFHLSMRKRQRL